MKPNKQVTDCQGNVLKINNIVRLIDNELNESTYREIIKQERFYKVEGFMPYGRIYLRNAEGQMMGLHSARAFILEPNISFWN